MAMNECVSAKEVLSLFWRFESLHLSFSATRGPM